MKGVNVSRRPARSARYVVGAELGRGWLGTVYEAHDEQLGRTVALKVLNDGLGERHVERLVREARACASLRHPNVVSIFEVGEHQGRWAIAMERVRGQTLRAWQERRPGWRRCVRIYLQAARGLAAAHAASLLHRDFKPDHVLLDESGLVRVLGFGRVGMPTDDDEPDRETVGTETQWGTPEYLPPEQVLGAPPSALGDQYSFCVSLYEAVAGRRPFCTGSAAQRLRAKMLGQPGPVPPRMPRALWTVLQRGLHPDPRQRWPSMQALVEQLCRLEQRGLAGWLRRLTTATADDGSHEVELVPELTGEAAAESTAPDAGLPAVSPPPASPSTVASPRVEVETTVIEQHMEGLLDRMRDRPRTPRSLGRYTVGGVLGRGGMGTVLSGHDQALQRPVALKLLHEPCSDPRARRLRREARALAKLSCPHVVEVYEVGEDQGRWFIAMERIEGRTLRKWQATRPGWQACVHAYLQAGRGLAAAHAAGLTHRDFKPDNCLIDEQGRVRVLDFGLVRDDDPDERVEPTAAGTLLGTPGYMSLEQLVGGPVGPLGDQFSFCASLYEAVYGQRPFDGDTLRRQRAEILQQRVRPAPADTRVPERLRRVLLRGLATAPSERWPSMDALLRELRRAARPRRWTWMAVAMTGGLLMAGLAWWGA